MDLPVRHAAIEAEAVEHMDKVVKHKIPRLARQGEAMFLPVQLGERLGPRLGHDGQIAAVKAGKEGAILRDGEVGQRLGFGQLVDKGRDPCPQALLGQLAMNGGGGVDHHGVGAAGQHGRHIGKALGDPILAGQLLQHRRIAGTEQRGDPLVARQQRQIGFLGDIPQTNHGNAHLNSFSLDNGTSG